MQIFYAPEIQGSLFILDRKESAHCIRVMRMKKGSSVKIIDGKGNMYEGIISKPDPEACQIEITSVVRDFERRPYRLHIAVSPLKNPDRFEWMVEKCVEIGVDEITPVICKKSEKKSIRDERIKNIIISAMKQSLKAQDTKLNAPVEFSRLINSTNETNRLIAHCDPELPRKGFKEAYAAGDNCIILIGPEGDFTSGEILQANSAGFESVHLGKSRLRTETAAISACHAIYLINQ